jgi:SAM-dependent methyltransferase
VKIGQRSGFDSGLSLDYVYQNKARGSLGVGRLIDRSYLNAIGWLGIRERKKTLENALRLVMRKTQAEGRPVHILDIASGAGRYVIETIATMPEMAAHATLRDYRQENVDAARALAKEFGPIGVMAELGDAFDRASFAQITPRPTIGIVSGLYELFPSNEMVLESLGGMADALAPGSYLIYTNQPWHPQVEFIARVLRNREGQPWVMRRRTTAEMDQLIGAAGFEKIEMEVDRWGMFTVSIARRIA